VGWVALRDRRVDPFAMFLMVVFGAGLALTFVTGDARFMLPLDVAVGASNVLMGVAYGMLILLTVRSTKSAATRS
jgi:hypothetical protein